MPEHIKRLVVLLVMAAVIAIVAKEYFTEESFGRYGHYRADSVPELASQGLKYQGPAYCKQCHTERHTQWKGGSHKSVSCENCHGAARDHPASGPLPIPTDTLKLCIVCHEAMPAKPAQHPQIDVKKHAGAKSCAECHNPHSPMPVKIQGMQEVFDQLIQPEGPNGRGA